MPGVPCDACSLQAKFIPWRLRWIQPIYPGFWLEDDYGFLNPWDQCFLSPSQSPSDEFRSRIVFLSLFLQSLGNPFFLYSEGATTS